MTRLSTIAPHTSDRPVLRIRWRWLPGIDAGELRLRRADLARSRWRVLIPESPWMTARTRVP